jgi:hypothetical protein
MPTKLTTDILTAAIDGLEIQKTKIDAQIAEIRQMLDGGSAPAAVPAEAPARKRRKKMSKAGRLAIAAAQRKRWADKKEVAPKAQKAPKAKRKLSAAGRRAIIAATKKRWAAKRAEAAKSASA